MADSRGNEAAQRAAELLRRERELAAHQAVTEDDVRRAAERATRAHERDNEAHRRVRQRHYHAAVAHERAAAAHELAAEEGLGDVDGHRRAAERQREAARRDLIVAQESEQQDAD